MTKPSVYKTEGRSRSAARPASERQRVRHQTTSGAVSIAGAVMILRTLRRILVCSAVLAIRPVSPCAAQLRPVSFEFNVGVGFGGSSAPHGSSTGLALDALLGFRPRARAAGGFVVAVAGSGQALGVAEASCDALPGVPCTPEFPEFWVLSALAGWETENGDMRFLAGPALAGSGLKPVGAMQARLDLAKPVVGHVSVLASARFAYLPKHRGDSFSLGSIGVGFRLR